MKVRIARIAKRMHNKFRGLNWRQMFVTVGMVLLTLFLLGVSFFSLSYNYARGQENGELAAQAQVVGQLSASYLENGRYLDMEELQHEEDFQRLASFAATVSEVDFLICDVEGHVLLSTDASLSGLVVTMPEEMTAEVLEEGISSRRTDVDGLYSNKRFVVGVPAISEDTPDPVGMVYAVSSTTSLDTMWSGFIGLFFMTAFVVLMISFMASSITTMRQIQPIREIAGIVKPYPGCRLHVDATQAVGKTDLWLDGVDTMSFTAHKFYGPNGIGALYKRRGLVIEPQISGGASTTIYRSGTPTLGLAVSLDAALTKALAGQDADVLGEGGTPLFAALLTAADKLGMQYVATTHRARVETGADGVHTVCPPAGTGSDDSTILAALPQETLARLILPLGDFVPEDVAEMAEDFKV